MKCEKCGNISGYIESRYVVKAGQSLFSNGSSIPQSYYGFTHIPCCEKCGAPFQDYKNLSTSEFFSWLQGMDETVDRELKGKALIRYFELDKLLELKKDAGD